MTYNVRDFEAIEQSGIEAMTPKTFLERAGASP
jgi:hypothetical protein